MIDNKQIRLGNKVSVLTDSGYTKTKVVIGINLFTGLISIMEDGGMFSSSDYKKDFVYPIELSEDWLFLLGFVKTNSTWFRKGHADFNININLHGECFIFDGDMESVSLKRPIRYIHEVQNICSDLLGD